MKTYTVIGGVNGVGKSTLSGVLSVTDYSMGIIVDPDKLIKKSGDRLKGGKSALELISRCLENNSDFSQETTLSGKGILKTLQAARKRGYYVRLYYVGLSSAEESLSRIANRVKKGGHDIPRDDVTRRFKRRFEDLLIILPFCDEACFFDNENGFVYVGEYKDGKLYDAVKDLPEWFTEMKMYYEGVK